ncbi:UDP-glucosyl transferase 71B6 [Hibiscus trionum]|uniref:Glycosyltransferase n=1 Tax=Hibiscus trionum TaxID=183268 RepID=A0A9W7INR4_HIBTR|nr:UDP-glucosyl transferase 71B6 [Hibiscus trionum]
MMKKAELVFIPVPLMGHLVPAVQVAKLLADLNSNLSITVLTVKPPHDAKVSAYVDSLTATTTTSSRIKFINVSQSELDVDVLKSFSNLVQTLGPLVKEVSSNIVERSNSVPGSPRLAGFVLDTFLTSFVNLANEFGVPSYAFYTSGAGSLGFHLYTQALHDEQKIEFGELKDSDTEFTIPSYVNPVSIKLFPTDLLQPERFTLFRNLTKWIRQVKGIMVNTFSELESHALDSLSKSKLQIPPVYPVGPILNLKGSNKIHQNYDTIMQWLDQQPRSSVVFLCFGSMGRFGVDQVKEIAYALEQSGHRFLWSLQRPAEQVNDMKRSVNDYKNVAEVLPEGFLDRTAEIGKVIDWAPQVDILGHPATGGFMSHCGWNSTLESIWFGVPMAAWPLFAEQQLNAFTLVEELGLAVEIKMDYKNDNGEVEIVKSEKIEREIKWLMGNDGDVRRKMKKMSDESRKVLIDDRSSHTMLRRFIDDVMNDMP